MLRQLQQIPYIKGLVKQLRRNKDMRSVCGYQSKAPTEAHFSQMKKHIGVKGFTAIEMWLRHEAIRLRKSQPLAAVELVQTACVDGTYFPAWSNRDPHDTGKGLGDPDARLGRGKKGLTIKDIAYYFDTTRQTVCRWLNRGKHRGTETFQDKHRQPKESKVTADVEVSILKLRSTFKWGTARIQQGLFKLPNFMTTEVPCVQGIRLSRETINRVLTAHGVNGYSHEYERWKFFRAKEPDELWQVDFKGPFSVQGKKYWFLVGIDDYSRFLRGG